MRINFNYVRLVLNAYDQLRAEHGNVSGTIIFFYAVVFALIRSYPLTSTAIITGYILGLHIAVIISAFFLTS